MVHVEVVLILPRLDEELEVSVFPPDAAAARPDAQRPILQEILVAFGREPEIRFGALAQTEPPRQQAHRPLVDLGGRDLQSGIATSRFVCHPGRRRVAEVLVLRADDGRDDLADAGAAVTTDSRERRIAALYPGAADEPHAGERERQLGLWAGTSGSRRHDGDAQRLHLPQTRRADLQGVGAERNPVQAPARTRVHAPVPHEIPGIADREHVTHEALRGPHAGD